MNSELPQATREENGRQGPTVLLVDDAPPLVRALARALRHQPFHIYTAHSAQEGMDIVKARSVDLIVSDENMPGLCGTKFLAWVKDTCPDIARIILTGQPSVPSAIRAINKGGVDRYFTKPCDVVELALAIRQILEEKKKLPIKIGL